MALPQWCVGFHRPPAQESVTVNHIPVVIRDCPVLVADPADVAVVEQRHIGDIRWVGDRKSTRLNSSHSQISYAVFCLKKKREANGERKAVLDLVTGSIRGKLGMAGEGRAMTEPSAQSVITCAVPEYGCVLRVVTAMSA